jgi:alpha-aminoadipate carrier protein LysW
MENAQCLSCGNEILFNKNPKMGMLVACSECGAELEVVWLDPLEVDWPYNDWDEEDDEELDDDDY